MSGSHASFGGQVVDTHWPPHIPVPGGHSQAHEVVFKLWPLVQSTTHCPLHSVVPDGHSHTQLVGEGTLPPEQR